MNSLIFDIQRFSIHDGPGIRTVVFFKGCNLECPWCQNPESIALPQELAFYPDKCIASGDCLPACAHGAIDLNSNIRINRELCIVCPECEKVCASGALKIIGKLYDVDEVFNEILKDKDYYESSGGGLTLSGGEPSLHFDFAYSLLERCKSIGIHTNIETNGFFKWEKFKKLLPFLNLIYFDIKIVEKQKHKDILHGDAATIQFNMEKLLENNAPVEFRLPLIPGYTSSDENLKDVIALLSKLNIKKLQLLPYHSLGEAKADKIDSKLSKLNLKPLIDKELIKIKNQFEKNNISVHLNR